MQEFIETIEPEDPTESYLKMGLTPQRTGSIEKRFQYTPSPQINQQDNALIVHSLHNRLDDYGGSIPSNKKPLIELKADVLQTGVGLQGKTFIDRTKFGGDISLSSQSHMSYDVLIEQPIPQGNSSGELELEFHFKKIKELEFVQKINIDDEGKVSGVSGISFIKKQGKNTFKLGATISTEQKVRLTGNVRLLYGKLGVKQVINYTIHDKTLSLKSDLTYKLIDNCSMLIAIKTKIKPEQIEINPVVGLQYTF